MPSSGQPVAAPPLRWWRYLGPWPLSPIPTAVIMWLSAATFAIARMTAQAQTLTLRDYPPVLVESLPGALAAFIVMWLFSRVRPPVHTRPVLYWLALALTIVTFVAVRYAMGLLPSEGFGSSVLVIVSALARTTVAVMFIQIVTGVTGYRLAAQVARTNEALLAVREQQEQMLAADERVRAQVSTLLHDRVQAGLIAACLELGDVADRADASTRGEIADVVHRLEELRGLDVRRAARTLSPDLADTDLQSVLDDLGAQYAPSMRVTTRVAPEIIAHSTRPPANALLGCYRIVEQALLNAAVHGRARECRVDISRGDTCMSITVDDDGVGMPLQPATGIGSALTTTWVRILGGAWTRSTSSLGGVRLSAQLDVHSEH